MFDLLIDKTDTLQDINGNNILHYIIMKKITASLQNLEKEIDLNISNIQEVYHYTYY